METLSRMETAPTLLTPNRRLHPESEPITKDAFRISSSEEAYMATRYLAPDEVADALEVSPTSVVRWVRDGILPAMRIGHRTIRIPRSEVERITSARQRNDRQ